MPGKQPRVLCPVCQETIPPDETECENCGAFVIDEAVVRLSRAFGLDREKALKLFDAGFRHPKQLADRDPDRVLENGEVGLLFICTNCGGFVAGGDSTCPRCRVEFESEPEAPRGTADILDLVLCPVCGADNSADAPECEICGETLREPTTIERVDAKATSTAPLIEKTSTIEKALEKVDEFLREWDRPISEVPRTAPARAAAKPETVPQAPVPRPTPAAPKPLAPVTSKTTGIAPPEKPASARPVDARPTRAEPRPATPTETSRRPPSRTPALDITPTPEAVSLPTPPSASRARVRAASSRIPQRRVPPSTQPPRRVSAETAGALVLAGALSLLLAGGLRQLLVSAGIAVLLAAFCAYVVAEHLRIRSGRPSELDSLFLSAGALVELSVPLLRGSDVDSAGIAILALAGAFPFAWATRRLLRDPRRTLLAIGSAIPVIGQALATAADPTYAMTFPWIIGILVAIPWPAALAATEVLRRQSSSILRRQLIRAERDLQRKDYERSLAEYDRAIGAARAGVPGAEIPWYGKGATLILLGRYDEALRAIDTALDINPRNEVAWVNKGNAFTKLGRLVDALRCFNAAIKVNPSYEVAWNNKGNALARLGKFEEALTCYERALDIDPGYRGAWVNTGFVLTKLGRFDEAASCADRALRLDPGRRAEPI